MTCVCWGWHTHRCTLPLRHFLSEILHLSLYRCSVSAAASSLSAAHPSWGDMLGVEEYPVLTNALVRARSTALCSALDSEDSSVVCRLCAKLLLARALTEGLGSPPDPAQHSHQEEADDLVTQCLEIVRLFIVVSH